MNCNISPKHRYRKNQAISRKKNFTKTFLTTHDGQKSQVSVQSADVSILVHYSSFKLVTMTVRLIYETLTCQYIRL